MTLPTIPAATPSQTGNLLAVACVVAMSFSPTASVAAAPPAASQGQRKQPSGTPVLIVGYELHASRGLLVGFDPGSGPQLADERGRPSRVESSRVLAVIAADPGADGATGIGAWTAPARRRQTDGAMVGALLSGRAQGLLVGVDGQRIPGVLDRGAKPDHVKWSNERRGSVQVPLDQLGALWLRLGPASGDTGVFTRAPAQDELRLSNGDALRGLLSGIDPDKLTIEIDGKPTDMPAARAEGVVFANPRRPLTGTAVWLSDGSVLKIESASTVSEDALVFNLPGKEQWKAELREVRGWVSAAQRLVALSSVPPTRWAPLGGRVGTDPPSIAFHADDLSLGGSAVLGARDVVLPGAMEAVYELPAGTTRLACTAALEDDAGAWGDCRLTLLQGGRETVSVRLNENEPAVEVNAAVGPGDVTIRLEPGRFGTPKNRVRLLRPLLLTNSK